MPYVDKKTRDYLDDPIDNLTIELEKCGQEHKESTGNLNYSITKLILGYLDYLKEKNGLISYEDLSKVRAVLLDISDEYYRRILSKYEGLALDKNGDVEGFDFVDMLIKEKNNG